MASSSTSLHLLARWITPVLLLAVSFLIAVRPVVVVDVWWQLRTGELILDGEQFPITHDVFSYTHPRADWINLPWLHQVISAASVRLGGVELLVFVKGMACLLAALGVLATAATIRRYATAQGQVSGKTEWSILSTVFFLIALASTVDRLRLRPEIWTFLCGAWLVFFLIRARLHSPRWLVGVLLIHLLWCNTHGGFAIGWVATAAFAAGQVLERLFGINQRRVTRLGPWLAVAVLAPLVCLINPRGWDGMTYPLFLFAVMTTEAFQVMRAVNQESAPLFLTHPFPPTGWLLIASVFLTLLGLIAFAWTCGRLDTKSKQPSPACRGLTALVRTFGLGYLLLFPALAYLSQTANRNVALFFFFIAPLGMVCIEVSANNLLSRLRDRRSIYVRRLNTVFAPGLAAAAYVIVATGFAADRLGLGLAPSAQIPLGSTVEGPVRFIREHKIRGPWFSDAIAADYFIYRLGPEYQVFIDTRYIEIYCKKDTRFMEYYMACLNEGAVFDNAAKQFEFQAVLLSFDLNITQHLVAHLLRARDWAPVFLDGSGVIFLRTVEENMPLIKRFALTPPTPTSVEGPTFGSDRSPLTPLYVSEVAPIWGKITRLLCLGLGQTVDPHTEAVLDGQALALMGYWDKARLTFERLASEGTKLPIWGALGNLRMKEIPRAALVAPLEDDSWAPVNRPQREGVEEAFARALQHDPTDIAALSGEALMLLSRDEPKNAYALLERALRVQDWWIPIRLLAGLAAERAGYRAPSDTQREKWWRRAVAHYEYLQHRTDCPAEARVRLALLYARQNRIKLAQKTARQAIEQGIPPSFITRLRQRITEF